MQLLKFLDSLPLQYAVFSEERSQRKILDGGRWVARLVMDTSFQKLKKSEDLQSRANLYF